MSTSYERTASFGVKRKDNDLWFGGFARDKSALWVGQDQARRMSRLSAEAQAALFRRFDSAVQQKPVALS